MFSPLPFESYRVHLIFVTYYYCTLFHVRCHSPVPSVLYCLPSVFLQSLGCFWYPYEIIRRHQSRHCIVPHRDSCTAASTATIMSPIYTLNKSGDNVHPCATPCKISTYLDVSPSSVTALLAHSVIFLIILQVFPLIPISHNFSHDPLLRSVS